MAKKQQADEGIDSLLGELDAMSSAPPPPPAPAADDLDSLLGDLGVLDPPEDDGLEMQELLEPQAVMPAEALPLPRPPRARRLLLLGAALASHGALFGLGYWLGGSGAGHGEAAAHGEGEVKLEGVLRYVGQQADAKIDGQVIFTSPEVREAVLELAGGQALADAMTRFSRSLRSLGPVTRHGDLVEASACNPAACEREAYKVRYDQHSRAVWVCQTAPFASGASLSYLYDAEGMQEVSHCVGAAPPPRPAPSPETPGEPAEQPAAEAAPEATAPAEPGENHHGAGD